MDSSNKTGAASWRPLYLKNGFYIILASLVINLLAITIPVTLMQIYDRVLPYQAYNTLLWLTVGCSVALVLEGALRIARGALGAHMAAEADMALGSKTVERILRSDIREYEREGFGVYMERLNGVAALRGFFSGQIFLAMLDLPFIIFFLLIIAYLSPKLALIPVVMIVLHLCVIKIIQRQYEKARWTQSESDNRRYGFVIQMLNGIHGLVASALEEQTLRRYESLQNFDTRTKMTLNFWNMLPGALSPIFSMTNMFLVILAGCFLFVAGKITIGALTAATLLAGRAMQPAQQIADLYLRYSEFKLAYKKLDEIGDLAQDAVPGTADFPMDIRGTIEVRDVSFRYDADSPYLFRKMSFAAPENRFVAINGEGTSGTTTLLYLLLGVLRPDSGAILLGNNNLSQWNHSDFHNRVEYVPQNGEVFNGAVIDNIAMFDRRRYMAARDAARLLGLDQLVSQLPNGYETVIDKTANMTLSPNLIQRIAIARAFVTRPRILLLDKTNEALDAESDELFMSLLGRMKGICTIVMVTTQRRVMEMADVVYAIKDGQLAQTRVDAG